VNHLFRAVRPETQTKCEVIAGFVFQPVSVTYAIQWIILYSAEAQEVSNAL